MSPSNNSMPKKKRNPKNKAFKKPIGYMQIPMRAIHSMHIQREHRPMSRSVPFGDPPSAIYEVTGSKCTIVVDLDLCGGAESVEFQMPK